jgi:hypothetical protein
MTTAAEHFPCRRDLTTPLSSGARSVPPAPIARIRTYHFCAARSGFDTLVPCSSLSGRRSLFPWQTRLSICGDRCVPQGDLVEGLGSQWAYADLARPVGMVCTRGRADTLACPSASVPNRCTFSRPEASPSPVAPCPARLVEQRLSAGSLGGDRSALLFLYPRNAAEAAEQNSAFFSNHGGLR